MLLLLFTLQSVFEIIASGCSIVQSSHLLFNKFKDESHVLGLNDHIFPRRRLKRFILYQTYLKVVKIHQELSIMHSAYKWTDENDIHIGAEPQP